MGRNKLVMAGMVILALVIFVPQLWAQPLSMGKIELQGKAVVKAGEGLVFQAPKEAEAPLMSGSAISTGNGKALVSWTDKGSMVLDSNSKATVTEDGFELNSGKLSLRVNPGQTIKVKALGKVYTVKAPTSKVAEATIIVKNNSVKTAGLIFLNGGGSAGAPGYLGPALLAGGSAVGIAAVAASASNNGGGGVASPSAP